MELEGLTVTLAQTLRGYADALIAAAPRVALAIVVTASLLAVATTFAPPISVTVAVAVVAVASITVASIAASFAPSVAVAVAITIASVPAVISMTLATPRAVSSLTVNILLTASVAFGRTFLARDLRFRWCGLRGFTRGVRVGVWK